jgi:hypothetical protein
MIFNRCWWRNNCSLFNELNIKFFSFDLPIYSPIWWISWIIFSNSEIFWSRIRKSIINKARSSGFNWEKFSSSQIFKQRDFVSFRSLIVGRFKPRSFIWWLSVFRDALSCVIWLSALSRVAATTAEGKYSSISSN